MKFSLFAKMNLKKYWESIGRKIIMNKLTIVAYIEAKKDKVDLVKNELLNLLEITRNEEGCINYNLHQNNDESNKFVFYENWESRELWQKHMNNDHLNEYMRNTEGSIEKFILQEMTEIDN